jgi:hypothetical protein
VLLNGTPSTGSSPVWRQHTTIESPPQHLIVVRGDLESLLRDLGQRLNPCMHLGVQDLDGVHLTRHCRDYCHTMSQLHVSSETVTPQIGVFEYLPGTTKRPHRLGAQRGIDSPYSKCSLSNLRYAAKDIPNKHRVARHLYNLPSYTVSRRPRRYLRPL